MEKNILAALLIITIVGFGKLAYAQTLALEVDCTASVGASSGTQTVSALTGQLVTWSANVTGGETNINYSWSGLDGLAGKTKQVNKIYYTPGVKIASITVSSGGVTKTVPCSNAVAVLGPPLSPPVSSSPSPSPSQTPSSSAPIFIPEIFPSPAASILPPPSSVTSFPTHFRVANDQASLELTPEQIFNPPAQTIDWELPEGNGLKIVYAQFKVAGVWGPILSAQINLITLAPSSTPASLPVATITTSPSPTPTSKPTPTPSPTPRPSPSPSATIKPTLTPTPTPTPTPAANKFDLNNDGEVNSADVSIFLAEWKSNKTSKADFNDDGFINSFDYALLQTNFTQ